MIVFAKYLALQLFNDFYYFPLRFKLFGFSFTMDRQQSVVRRLCVKQLPLSTVKFYINLCEDCTGKHTSDEFHSISVAKKAVLVHCPKMSGSPLQTMYTPL